MHRSIAGPVRLATVVGTDDAPLLPHLIAHYRDLGVEEFSIACHAESPDSEGYALWREMCTKSGITPFHTHFGHFRDFSLNQRLLAFIKEHHPDDWFIVCDADEMHVYDRPLSDLLKEASERGCDHINGCFLDRVGEDGILRDITSAPLWEQFPLAGQVSAAISKALPLKTGIAKGRLELLSGQHGARGGKALHRSLGLIQVHHFKWTSSVVDRLRARIQAFGSREVRLEELAMMWEAKFSLTHIDEHGGRIDVTDERLRVRRTGALYGDYSEWDYVADHSSGWAWTLTY